MLKVCASKGDVVAKTLRSRDGGLRTWGLQHFRNFGKITNAGEGIFGSNTYGMKSTQTRVLGGMREVPQFSTFQRRHLAIGETLISMAEKGMSGGKEKQFQEMLNMMTSETKWSLKPWKKTMDTQLDSWMMYVPGVSSSEEVQEIKGFKTLLDAMTDAELENPESINGAARERIAAKAGKTQDDVTRMLFFYKQSLIICTWLQTKKKAGEALPTTEAELQEMQASDGRLGTIAKNVMNPKGRRSGRGRRLPF